MDRSLPILFRKKKNEIGNEILLIFIQGVDCRSFKEYIDILNQAYQRHIKSQWTILSTLLSLGVLNPELPQNTDGS